MATTTRPSYQIHKTSQLPAMDCNWDAPVWGQADVAVVAQFQPDGSDHRPRTEARLLHHEEGLCGIFKVEDQYVRATHTQFQSNVYLDACVELFIRPKADKGYMNFEMNCCGTLLHYYIEDWRPKGDRFEKFTDPPP